MNYFNEIHAVWEPLIERIDGGARRWNLELEVRLSALPTVSRGRLSALILVTLLSR